MYILLKSAKNNPAKLKEAIKISNLANNIVITKLKHPSMFMLYGGTTLKEIIDKANKLVETIKINNINYESNKKYTELLIKYIGKLKENKQIGTELDEELKNLMTNISTLDNLLTKYA
uniref:Uncharacterized protein n=1 Tax=viral metagenome TaxID=1070528 RepID=A0A6C0EDS8_9ZZZZ